MNILKKLYTLLITLGIPFLYLRLLWKSRKNSAYRKNWLERLGIFTSTQKPNGIWLHAVSAGEAITSVPLILALKEAFPAISITVTTTTPTGRDRIQHLLGNKVQLVYFPFDLPFTMKNLLSRVQPKCCILMETELWPNCLDTLQKASIKVFIVNARLSPRSLKGYKRIETVTRQMLSAVTMVAAQSRLDGDRFLTLHLPTDRLTICGNIKFDVAEPINALEKANGFRRLWGEERPVWIAASTHPGEEEFILKTFLKVREKINDALLVLAPRHPERQHDIIKLIQTYALNMTLRTDLQIEQDDKTKLNQDTAVLLVNTMGEMPIFYRAANVAFVGGSLVPIGGHNTLEPASAKIPAIVGPHTYNFIDINESLIKAGALKQIHNIVELEDSVVDLLKNPAEQKRIGEISHQVFMDNQGAVKKIVQLIKVWGQV